MNEYYRVYLLRIWPVGRAGVRIMLEKPGTHETIGFANLDELQHYLQEIEAQSSSPTKALVNSPGEEKE